LDSVVGFEEHRHNFRVVINKCLYGMLFTKAILVR